jgi:hypothetical protein
MNLVFLLFRQLFTRPHTALAVVGLLNSYPESLNMAVEARITINGTALTDEESRVVRLGIDALAEIISEQMALKDEGVPSPDAYLAAIGRVQSLVATTERDSLSVN